MSNHAIRLHAYGPPENLKWEEVPVSPPGHGEILLRQTAIGLNYIDVYQRTGLYQLPGLPGILGQEAAGEVEAVGEGVTDLRPGDRVAYAGGPAGAYTEHRVLPATRVVHLPEAISTETAAAMMLKGMTAGYLLRMTYPVKKGDTVLIHAAAGGVGLILCQWARHLGARVIGTVSSQAKADLAREHGCEFPLIYTEGDWIAEIKKLTRDRGVQVVYDSVGKTTFAGSLDCLAPRGMLVSFGQTSGPIPLVDTTRLAARSLFLTRPRLSDYTATRSDLLTCAEALFEVIAAGTVKCIIDQQFALSEAAAAHRAIEQRRTTGSTILTV